MSGYGHLTVVHMYRRVSEQNDEVIDVPRRGDWHSFKGQFLREVNFLPFCLHPSRGEDVQAEIFLNDGSRRGAGVTLVIPCAAPSRRRVVALHRLGVCVRVKELIPVFRLRPFVMSYRCILQKSNNQHRVHHLKSNRQYCVCLWRSDCCVQS